VLIGAAILAGTAAYLLWGPQRESLDQLLGITRTQAKAPLPAPPAPAPPTPSKTRKPVPVPEVVEEEPEPPPLPPLPVFPFPRSADVPAGMERTKLVAAFGPPHMRTTSAEKEGLEETYVYFHKEGSLATHVLIRGARVVSAHTAPY
jgi:hypothetical protein